MLPIDPAGGARGRVLPGQPRHGATAHPAAGVVPPQAAPHGSTFVRPGAVVWGGTRKAPEGAYSSCEYVEQLIAAAGRDGGQIDDLLDELTRVRLWIPLPPGRPVTDGTAVSLPTVTYLGAEFVPCFTSVQRLGRWANPPDPDSPRWQRAGDPRSVPHIVVPTVALARLLPGGLGMAVNPGAEVSVPISPDGVRYLASADAGLPVSVGDPPEEPEKLLDAVSGALRSLPAVRDASRAWLSVPGRGQGLIISVTVRDPASEPAREAVLGAIEHAVASVPELATFPIDVTFPGESGPDLVDDWVARETRPFYTRA